MKRVAFFSLVLMITGVLSAGAAGAQEKDNIAGPYVPTPWPIVDGIAPQPPGLGPAPARVEHRQRGSSRARESHPRALTEPYVNLSAHTALVAQPDPRRKDQCANSRGRA